MELWAQDEARLGLIPITRRVWAPKGQRPKSSSKRRYEWVYVYGFVCPSTGKVQWLILPTVNTELFELALAEFARATGASSEKHIAVVLDQAGWHKAKGLKVPEGIHLIFQPAHSPELQPAEHLWPLLRETVANDWFETIEKLENTLFDRCRYLRTQPDLIRTATHFHWWQQIEDQVA